MAKTTLAETLDLLATRGIRVLEYDTNAANEPEWFASYVEQGRIRYSAQTIIHRAIGFLGYGENITFTVSDMYGRRYELKLWYVEVNGNISDHDLRWSTDIDFG